MSYGLLLCMSDWTDQIRSRKDKEVAIFPKMVERVFHAYANHVFMLYNGGSASLVSPETIIVCASLIHGRNDCVRKELPHMQLCGAVVMAVGSCGCPKGRQQSRAPTLTIRANVL